MADIINNIRRFLRGKSVVVRFILINVAVFFAIQLTAIAVYLADARFDLAALLVMPSDVSRLIQRPWTVVSYMFTHVDFFHILGNMLWLYCFGVIFLDLYENRAFTRVYIIGGLAGAAAYCAVALFTPTASLVGASAAVLAVIGLIAASVLYCDLRAFIAEQSRAQEESVRVLTEMSTRLQTIEHRIEILHMQQPATQSTPPTANTTPGTTAASKR